MDRWVIEQNIARFRELLRRDIDSSQRRELERLLDQEEQNLKQIEQREKRG